MRISDWSSDVCSSDLEEVAVLCKGVVQMLTRMDDDPDRHLHATVFQHLRKGLAQPLPKIGIVRDALVIDDDQQAVIGAVPLFRVRLVDPIAARLADRKTPRPNSSP